MKTKLIGLGLALAIFTGSFFTSVPVLADSFFKDAMKLGGKIYEKTGEAMEELGEKQKDSTLGKGLKIGGKVHKTMGTTLEKTANELPNSK
jgi:hypothetical protein